MRRLAALGLVAWLAGAGCVLGCSAATSSAHHALSSQTQDARNEARGAAQSAASVVGTRPELTLRDLSGVEQSLASLRGRVVVLNFWATWCEPCRREMPDLVSVQNDYAALGVQIVGAAADASEDRAKVLQFIKETKINFPVWTGATARLMPRFGLAPVLPGTVVLDREGKIVSATNAVIDRDELRKQIDALLAAAPAKTTAESPAKDHKDDERGHE